jgi:hypothetical protein
MSGLRQMELVNHLHSYFPDRPHLGVYQNVSLAIERLTFGQQVADFVLWVRLIEQRAVGMLAHPFVNCIG